MFATKPSSSKPCRLKNTTIFYHYFALYRLPVLRMLTEDYEAAGGELTLVSSPETNVPSIQLINPELAKLDLADGGLRWEFLQNKWLGRNFLWQVGLVRKSLFSPSEVLVYLGNPYFISTWVAAALSRLKGKRILFWTHGITHQERGLRRLARKLFFHLAHGLLLYSRWSKDHLVRHYGFRPENLYVIYNSLDYDAQLDVRQNLRPGITQEVRSELFPHSANDPVLVYIGRLTARKNLGLLLEAARLLGQASHPVNVLIIGSGPVTEELRDTGRDLGLGDRLCLHKACYEEKDIGRLLGASDLCVVPDNIGLTCIHSLVYGTPVVTHGEQERHGPEFEAISPGFNGAYFKRGDEVDLANTIKQWFLDHPERDMVRKSCYEVVDKFYNPHLQSEIFQEAVNGHAAESQPAGTNSKYGPPSRDGMA